MLLANPHQLQAQYLQNLSAVMIIFGRFQDFLIYLAEAATRGVL